MPNMGIEKLCISKQLTDTATSMTFTVPQYYEFVQELGIKPKTNSASAYAENRKVDQDVEFDSADMSLSTYQLTNAQRAFILGQDTDQYGGAIGSQGDEVPWITCLYKAKIRVGGQNYYRYGVVYKTQFQTPDDDYKTQEGKPDFSQVPKLTGSAQPTEWSYKNSKGITKHPWEYHLDTCDPNCPKDIDDWWFDSVYIPTIAPINKIALASSVPTNNDTSIPLSEKPTLTFNNLISDYSNVLFYNVTDGVIVVSTKTLDVTGKILTITPTTSLIAGKTYNIIAQGIVDVYGQILDTQLIKFTTVTSAS
ncbi:major tail protein [Clostridium felsineum]|uniref:Uncharacterized protein n=1 Tax=Clostridium felsineum TaxID=36839 RepID=A0A1S8MDV8_9CLOT|nr:major tail protein [Clostridium felsineum]URZ06489.1 hypothetical protein CLROS_018220 [Clostridium felsineum]URZ11524.1 hypothetical protein CROST_022410 [Clostridium felsineum]